MVPLPENLVTNIPFVEVSQEVDEDICFKVTAHQIPRLARLIGTNLQVKNEGDDSSVKKKNGHQVVPKRQMS
jgi:hypothetical protein